MNAGLGQRIKSQCTEGQPSSSAPQRHSVVRSLCRCGAGTRLGGASRLLVGAVVVTGCNFTDFSKTSNPEIDAGVATEPACLKPSTINDAGVSPVAHWTFDNVLSDRQLLDDNQFHLLIPSADDQADAGVAALVEHPSINGGGQSLSLDGHQFVRSIGAADSDLLADEFTLSAWVSVPARVFTSQGPGSSVWPIVSTLGNSEQCNGYQLDIRFSDASKEGELVLSYQANEANDAGGTKCVTLSLHASLNVPSWATGTGRWHQVAGTRSKVSDDSSQLALYWDGKRIALQDSLKPLDRATGSIDTDEHPLFIGASAPNAASAAQPKFNGYIDDVAIFNRPLTEQELANFVLAFTTRPGPSNCRWRASEQWDKKTASSPSYAQWSELSSPDALTVNINDQDWGAGALDARLIPPRDLQLYDKAYLTADIPAGQAFQFTLASGDNYCTWVYTGNGTTNYRYPIDLTRPVNCVSSSCEVDLHRMDRASVTSEWAVPFIASKERPPGGQSFTIRGLDFSPVTGDLPDWSAYGGVYGLQGFCWRLQAYEPQTTAQWKQGSTLWSDSVSASLYGPTNSGTRLVADFGDRPLDLSGCTSVVLRTALDSTSSNAYAFVIQDEYGDWRSYDLNQNQTSDGYIIADLNIFSSSSDHRGTSGTTPNFLKFNESLDTTRIRLLGIQKPWGDNAWRSVTLSGLQFFGNTNATGAPNCERAGVN